MKKKLVKKKTRVPIRLIDLLQNFEDRISELESLEKSKIIKWTLKDIIK